MDIFTWQNMFPLVALLALLCFAILKRPLLWITRLLLRSTLSFGFLLLWSATGLFEGLLIGASWFNALTIGALGIPGFGLLLFLRSFTFT